MTVLAQACSSPSERPEASVGQIHWFENFPSRLIDDRPVAVWLPEDYDPQKKYAVIYMHDGNMLFDKNITWNNEEWMVDEVVGKLIQEQKIRPCIAVGIYNNGKKRHAEYFPQKPFEALPKSVQDSLLYQAKRNPETPLFEGPVYADLYLKFIVEELKPIIDQTFSTYKDQANTFIMGSSMGGLISMYALCEYPETFGGAACMSTHWVGALIPDNNPIPDAFMNYLSEHLPTPGHHKIYFDYGTETLDALYEPFQMRADEVLRARGYTAKDHLTRKFVGDAHSEAAWQKRLHVPLGFLLE